jgi:hypothetical protein
MRLGSSAGLTGAAGVFRAGSVRMLAGIAVAVFLACMPAFADAHPKRFSSHLALFGATVEFIGGELSSPSARCIGGRTIRLEEPGATGPVTAVQSDDEGRFQIPAADIPPAATRLLVSAVRPRVGRQRVCRADAAELTIDRGALSGGSAADAFGGRLSSSAAACVPGRRIELYEISSDPVFVGFNFTDPVGDWVIAAAAGAYEARALPAILGGPDVFIYCRPLISPPWVFEEPI